MSQETVASLEEQLNTALAELETERQRTRAANNKAGTAERLLLRAQFDLTQADNRIAVLAAENEQLRAGCADYP